MYEKFNGSDRLISALKSADARRLANILYYNERQLEEDIQALEDIYKDACENKKRARQSK